MERNDEEMVLFATSIAMQLAKGLSIEELEDLRCLINQVACSLSTLIANRCNAAKCNKHGKHQSKR